MITKHLLTGSTVAGIAAAALALSACGSGSGTGTTGTSGAGSGDGDDPQAAMLAFAQCMREHGVDMPDPEVDSKGRVRMRIGGKDTPPATMEAAQKACEDKMPKTGNGGDGDADPAFQEYGLKLAKCMREHGIEKFPDPTDNGIRITPDMGIDPDDPAFEKAQADCEQQIGEPPAPGDDA